MYISQTIKDYLVRIVIYIHWKIFKQPMGTEMKAFFQKLGWMTIGSVGSMFLLSVVGLISVRIMGPTEYGKYALALSTAQILIIPMLLGLNTSMVRNISSATEDSEKKAIASSGLIVGTALILVVALFGRVFANLITSQLKIDGLVFEYAIVYSMLLSMFYLVEAILKGRHQFKNVSILSVANSASVVIAFFLIYAITRGTSFQIYTVSVFIGLLLYVVGALKDILRSPFLFRPAIIKKLFDYGVYAVIGGIAGIAFNNADKFILNHRLGDSSVGLYTAYMGAALLVPGLIQQIFINVFFPVASSISDKTEITKKLKTVLSLAFPLLVVLNIPVILFFVWLYGKSFEFNFYYACLFSFVAGLVFVQNTLSWYLSSFGKNGIRFSSVISVIFGGVNIIAMMLLVRTFGLIGPLISLSVIGIILITIFLDQTRNLKHEI